MPQGFFLCILVSSSRAQVAPVDRVDRCVRHSTFFRPRMCFLGVPLILNVICGSHLKKCMAAGCASVRVFILSFLSFFIGHSSSCIFGIK